MQKTQTKRVYILLTKHDDTLSKIVRWISRSEYTHVSIAVEDDMEHFFSFKRKPGFCIERPFKIFTEEKRNRYCQLYYLEVSIEVYKNVKEIISQFQKNANQYQYNLTGLITCFLRMSYSRDQAYFCSQFVSEVLFQSGAMELCQSSSLYLPNDFVGMEELQLNYSGTLGKFVMSP